MITLEEKKEIAQIVKFTLEEKKEMLKIANSGEKVLELLQEVGYTEKEAKNWYSYHSNIKLVWIANIILKLKEYGKLPKNKSVKDVYENIYSELDSPGFM